MNKNISGFVGESLSKFHLTCECTDASHIVDCFVDNEDDEVAILFSITTRLKSFTSIKKRIIMAYNIIFNGHYEHEFDMILDIESAKEFSISLEKALK